MLATCNVEESKLGSGKKEGAKGRRVLGQSNAKAKTGQQSKSTKSSGSVRYEFRVPRGSSRKQLAK